MKLKATKSRRVSVVEQKILAQCCIVMANAPFCVCENRKLHTYLPGYGHQAPGTSINAVFKYSRGTGELIQSGD